MRKDKLGFPVSDNFIEPKKAPKQKIVVAETPVVEVQPPKPTGLSNEQLWETYSVKGEWPINKKIELLILMWELSTAQLADVLGMHIDDVQTHVQHIEDGWKDLGRTLTKEERDLARGRQIAELERLRAQLEEVYMLNKDPKFLTQKANVLDKLAKLRWLEQDKRAINTDSVKDGRSLQEQIDSLPVDKNRELLDRLKHQEPD